MCLGNHDNTQSTPEDRAFTPPRAIARVLKVIEVLAEQARRMSLAELSAALDVPKTSLFAILKGLAQVGYGVFESDTYVLGPRARKLAESIHGGRSFSGLARPILEGVARISGETVIPGTLNEDRKHALYALDDNTLAPVRLACGLRHRPVRLLF